MNVCIPQHAMSLGSDVSCCSEAGIWARALCVPAASGHTAGTHRRRAQNSAALLHETSNICAHQWRVTKWPQTRQGTPYKLVYYGHNKGKLFNIQLMSHVITVTPRHTPKLFVMANSVSHLPTEALLLASPPPLSNDSPTLVILWVTRSFSRASMTGLCLEYSSYRLIPMWKRSQLG